MQGKLFVVGVLGWVGLLSGCDPASEDGSTPEVDAPEEVLPPVFAPLESGEVEVPTVAQVDVERYLGTWYEIATYPIFFQRQCARTSATYSPRDEGGLVVFNQCRLGGIDGEPFDFTGKALPTDDTFAKLEVSFFGDNGAPYWVIELDGREGEAPYGWALVSDPTMATLWILARTPQLDEVVLEGLLERLEARGYDVEALSYTQQPAEPYDPVAEP
jgi:apolipoprotein D and lipocalin family protein